MSRKENLKKTATEMASSYREKAVRISAIKEETTNLLDGFHKVLVAMSSRSRVGLAKVSMGFRKKDFKKKEQTQREIKQIHTAIKRMRADVSQMLDEFHQHQAETAAAWRDLVTTMRATREGMPVEKLKEEMSENGEEETFKIDFPPLNGNDF